MGSIKIEDNSGQVLSALEQATARALEIIGGKAETHAKYYCPTGTPETTGKKGYRGGTLKNSITHQVIDQAVMIGSNVEYAPYVELGTGPNFVPPPEWEQFNVPRGKGLGHGYITPRNYLRRAIENHIEEYKNVIETELKRG